MAEWIRRAEMMGHRISVRAQETVLWRKRLGQFEECGQTVQINADCTVSLQKLTAIHELTHLADSIFGLGLSENRTDFVAAVLQGLLVQSPAVIEWLTGSVGFSGTMPLQFLSGRFAVLQESGPLWDGPSVRINLRDGLVLVEREAGEQEQRRDFLEVVLEAGLQVLHTDIGQNRCAALAEAWLSLLRNSPEMVSWWTEKVDGT